MSGAVAIREQPTPSRELPMLRVIVAPADHDRTVTAGRGGHLELSSELEAEIALENERLEGAEPQDILA